jgi:hypothetical protein
MSEYFENRKNEVALRRFAAVSFIEQKLREGFGLVEAIRLAALRPWPDENGRSRPHALWKITGMRGKVEVLPPSSPKAAGMKVLFAS